MLKGIHIYIVFLLISIGLGSMAAPADTTISKTGITILNVDKDRIGFQNVDSSLNSFHYYFPYYNSADVNIGNLGQPVLNYSYRYQSFFKMAQDNVLMHYHQPVTQYYLSDRPYTRLFYANGNKKEQYFNAVHSQRVFESLNYTVHFNKINSDGFYANNKTNHTNAGIGISYHLKKRYQLFVDYDFVKIANQVNGGISSDTLFEMNIVDNEFIDVNLKDASNAERNHNIKITQFYNLTGNAGDSVKSRNSYRIFLASGFSDRKMIYSDPSPDSLYYSRLFSFNVLENVFDSIHYRYANNRIGCDNRISGKKILFSAWAEHQYINYVQNNYIKDISNVKIGVDGELNTDGRLLFDFGGGYFFSGYNNGNFNVQSSLGYKFDSIGNNKVIFQYLTSKKTPDFYFSRFNNKNISWTNTFGEELMTKLGVKYLNSKFKVDGGINLYHLTNSIYFDTLVQPAQLNDAANLFTIDLSKSFQIKKIHFTTKLIYQKALDNDVFRIPVFLTFTSLYYESYLFRKAMLIRFGTDVFYHTEFYANGYVPLYGSFYFQEEKKIGNYPYFDFYVAAQIKKARIFVKVAHLNSGFMENPYYSAYHYPAMGRSLRLGVDWTFWD